jgi:5'-nucleotidase
MPPRSRAVPRQRVLVVNDDGIDAPGLRAVVVALAARFDVHVCAPAVEKSASSHAISIHAPVSAEPRVVPGAARAFACGGGATPADCAMLALDVLFADDGDARAFDVVVSGVNRGENCGRHVVYSGTVAAAREGAMRADAVGVAVSLDSYARDASYDHAAATCARIVEAILLGEDDGATLRALRGKTLNVNVPATARECRQTRATAVGASCTRARWVPVPDPAGVVAKHAKGYEKRKRHASVTVGAVEAPRKDASVDGELEPTPSTRNIKGWRAGTRWFRNRPGSITRDGTVGTDRCALDAGFVSVSLLETAGGGTRLGGARARLPATAFAEAGDVAAFFAKASEELR